MRSFSTLKRKFARQTGHRYVTFGRGVPTGADPLSDATFNPQLGQVQGIVVCVKSMHHSHGTVVF